MAETCHQLAKVYGDSPHTAPTAKYCIYPEISDPLKREPCSRATRHIGHSKRLISPRIDSEGF